MTIKGTANINRFAVALLAPKGKIAYLHSMFDDIGELADSDTVGSIPREYSIPKANRIFAKSADRRKTYQWQG